MTDGDVPAELQAFVNKHLPSIEHVEVLVLLASAERSWSLPEIATALAVRSQDARSCLRDLADSGLVNAVDADAFRLHPTKRRERVLIDALARGYNERPLLIAHALRRRPGQPHVLSERVQRRQQ